MTCWTNSLHQIPSQIFRIVGSQQRWKEEVGHSWSVDGRLKKQGNLLPRLALSITWWGGPCTHLTESSVSRGLNGTQLHLPSRCSQQHHVLSRRSPWKWPHCGTRMGASWGMERREQRACSKGGASDGPGPACRPAAGHSLSMTFSLQTGVFFPGCILPGPFPFWGFV